MRWTFARERSAGPLYSNIFSTTATGGDGYSFTFNDNNDKITLKYDGTTLTEATVSGLFTASENWQKVAINYERGRIVISVGASRKFFYQDIERETPYVNGEYINFSSASTDGRKIRNLKITNGAKWTYAGESNVVYSQGSVGIGVTDPAYTLDVGGDINLSGSFYQGGAPFVSSLWTDGANSLYYRSNVEVGTGNLFVDTTTSNVGIGTTTPGYELDVTGNVNFTGDLYQGGAPFVSSLWTVGPESLYYRSNIEAGTANLFVDTTTGRVGIGTTTPAHALDVVGTVNADIYEGDGGLLSNIASNLETITTNGNVTSNTVQFTNSNVGIVATGNVEANYFIGKGTELEGVALSTDLDDNSSRITTLSNDLSDNSSRIATVSSDLSDNSSRITTLSNDLSDNSSRIATLSTDLSDNSLRIATVSSDLSDNASRIDTILSDLSDNSLRIATVSSDLSDNSSRITDIESGDITLTGDKTFSDNVTVNGNLFVGSNLYVDDLGSNVLVVDGNASMETLTLGDIGIVPSYGLNHVTAEYNQTGDTIISTNATTGFNASSNIVAGGTVQANKIVSTSNLEVGTANLFVDTTTSNVGIGTNTPDYELDVVGNVNATYFIGDGSAISAIQSSNVSDFGSNVTRIGTLETDLGDNSSRITALETGNMSISGDKTFTGDIIFESNVHMNGGNVFVANTVNLTVSDPIIELGSNNIGANDLGIIMTRPAANSNVALVYDESADILRMGYTLNGASDSIVDLDSNALAVSVQGALSAASVSGDGSGLTSLNASNITTGALSTTSVTIDDYLIHDGDTDTKVGFPLADTFTVTTANSERLRVDSSGNVGIGTDSPAHTLDVHGTANVGALYSTLTYSNASANIVAWNSSTNEIIDSGLEKGFTEHPVVPMTDYVTKSEFGTYEASASSYDSGNSLYPWEAFDRNTSTRWSIGSHNGYNQTTGEWDATSVSNYPNDYTSDVGGTRYGGHWLQLKMPQPVVLSHSNVHPTNTLLERAPVDGAILGSNDGEHWYKLTQFSGKTYSASTWTRIDVNATTPYRYFRLCTTKVGTGALQYGYVELLEWRLFAEKDVTKMENLHISGDLSSETLQTGYIKWPRKSLKANESEGYVASASSTTSVAYHDAWRAFNGTTKGPNGDAWITPDYTFLNASGLPDTTNCATFDNISCEWIQITSPTKFALSHLKIFTREEVTSGSYFLHAPRKGRIYGSNDGITYTKLQSYDNLAYGGGRSSSRVDVSSNDEYSTYKITVDQLLGNGIRVDLGEIELFEAATGVGGAPTSAKLQVHGSLGLAKGSSLYAGDSVVAEFPKHDRPLTKYPEVAMTASTVGGYTVSEPTNTFHSNSAFRLHQAFDDSITSNWETFGGSYDTSTRDPQTSGSYVVTTVASGTTYYGVYAQMLAPFGVKVSHVDIRPQNTYGLERLPGIAVFVGSNDGTTWTLIRSVTNNSGALNAYTRYNVNATRAYKYIRIIWNKLTTAGTTTSFRDRAAASEIKIFGTEEGDESVDVVHRSVPNKPGTQHLDVYWDANDSNSYSFADSSNVYDLSGNGVTGTITGTNGFDTEYNAWVFDGSGDYIDGTLDNPSGDWVHSTSFWYRQDSVVTANWDYIYHIGTSTAGGASLFAFNSNGYLAMANYANSSVRRAFVPILGQWYHFTVIYSGGGVTLENVSVYLDAKLLLSTYNQGDGSSLSLSANTNIRLGADNSVSAGSATHGSIANFRLFGKTLNADQVRELYEYDAERFGHRTNVVALHKGNLGVGVTHPTARLEVAGADGLQEYPPKAMTGYETYMEGHGVFKASASTFVNNSYIPYYAFDKNPGTAWLNKNNSNNSKYQGTDYLYSGINGLGHYKGEWIGLKLPYNINLKKVSIHPRQVAGSYNEMPEDGVILGYNDETGEYETLDSWVGIVLGEYVPNVRTIQTTKMYNQFFLLGTRLVASSTNFRVGELKFFGTPAPSGLEDGHLTLGKALTAPRFTGHAAGAETPRAESLVVHYDTTVDSVASGTTVVDISGQGNNQFIQNGLAYSSSSRALDFAATNARAYNANGPNSAGSWVHSVSLWFKVYQSQGTLFFIGEKTTSKAVGLGFQGNNRVRYFFWGNDTDSPTNAFSFNTWTHVVATYDGGTTKSLYINGEKVTTTNAQTQAALSLATANDDFLLGAQLNGTDPFKGLMSNFKIWGGVALTAEEVAAEYALGRTGKSLNVTDTAVCIGGTVPRAQLDVRGSARFDGNVGIGTANPVATLDVNGSVRISGTMSLPGLPYAFVTYGTNTGWTAFNNSILPHSSVKVQSSHNAFDTSTYKFTCPNDGVYKISVSNLVGQNGYVHIYFQKNGARIDPNIHLNQNGKGPWWINMTGDHIVACSAGDELYINGHTGGTYTDIYVNSAYAYAYYQQIA